MSVAFCSTFWLSTKMMLLQHYLVVTWLVPCATAAVSAHILCTPHNYTSVYEKTIATPPLLTLSMESDEPKWCTYSTIRLLRGWFHMELLLSQCTFCAHHTTMHQFTKKNHNSSSYHLWKVMNRSGVLTQHYLVVTGLVPHQTAALSVSLFCVHHTTMHQFTPLSFTTLPPTCL